MTRGPVIGHARVLVADRRGEKFEEARGMVAGVGDHSRHERRARRSGDGSGTQFGTSSFMALSPDHSLGADGCTVRAEIGRGFSWRRGRGDWGLRLRRGVYVGASGPVAHGGSLAMRPASRAKPAW